MKQKEREKKSCRRTELSALLFEAIGVLILVVEAYPLIYVLSASFSSSDAISLGKVFCGRWSSAWKAMKCFLRILRSLPALKTV